MGVVLACVLACIVVPAWRWYILPDVMDMEEAMEEKDELDKKVREEADSDGDGYEPDKKVRSVKAKAEKMGTRASLIGLSPEHLQRRILEQNDQIKHHEHHLKQVRESHEQLQKEHNKLK